MHQATDQKETDTAPGSPAAAPGSPGPPSAAGWRFPDLFIVGAAKAGTTSLFYYLNQHPGIFMSVIDKEPGYFCDYWGIDDLPVYRALFDGARPEQIRGEASTPYLTCPASPGLIHQANPDAKIIIMLRNPVDRAYSLYNQMVKAGHETIFPFEKALAAEPRRQQRDPHKGYIRGYYDNYLYVESGKYAAQVQRYLETFSRENLRIILFDDLLADTRAVVEDTFRFLGLDPDIPTNLEPRNQSRFPRSIKLQFFITNVLGRGLKSVRVPVGERKLGIPGVNGLLKSLRNLNMGKRKPAPLNPDTRARLLAELKPDIEATAALIGRNLDHWLSPRSK